MASNPIARAASTYSECRQCRAHPQRPLRLRPRRLGRSPETVCCPHAARVDAVREVAQERKFGCRALPNGAGRYLRAQPVAAFAKMGKQTLFQDCFRVQRTIPGGAKLFKSERDTQADGSDAGAIRAVPCGLLASRPNANRFGPRTTVARRCGHDWLRQPEVSTRARDRGVR